MKVNTNVQGLRTTNHMSRLQNASGKVMEKLSSGLSINRAADNASGLAISEKMRAQIRGLAQADRNIQDAKSLMNTSESGLENIADMMQRMRELTISSLNDTYTELDRQLINEEFNQLKHAIDSATKHSEWSGKPVIDNHSPAYNEIQGNHVFPKSTAVRIISGLNDDLTITIDGIPRTVKLPEGEYEPVDILIDILDDLLIEIDPNLIAHVTEDRTISIQTENSQSIDHIKGGASFLFYEYTFGNPPGMIIGSTEYKANGKIEIIEGKSDELTFYIGDRQFQYTFPKGEYTKDEILQLINDELIRMGETEVEATAYGDEKIAITSNKYVITGIGGNMIEIDGHTSILYDNRQSGYISKSQATVSGYKDIRNDVKFTSANDKLYVYVENKKVEIDFLTPPETEITLSADQIIKRINVAFQNEGIQAKATISTSGRLVIASDYYGTNSSVVIDDVNSTAFDDLFVSYQEGYRNVFPNRGQNAVLQGYYTIGQSVEITDQNKVLTGQIDGQDFTIELDTKMYTRDELLAALNEKVVDLPIEFQISSSEIDGKSAITIKSTGPFGQISLDKNQALFDMLMTGTRVNIYSPTLETGKTTRIPTPEGIVAAPEYEYTPATAIGRSNLNNLEISTHNNKFTYELNGVAEEILLELGTYATATDFIDAHKIKFENQGLLISSNSLGQLIVKTKEVGEGQVLRNFGGNSYEFIMGKRVETEDVPPNSANSSKTTLTGIYEVPTDYKIDYKNNTLKFSYNHEGSDYIIEVELDVGTYATPVQLAKHLQEKISEKLSLENLDKNDVRVSVTTSGRFVLETSNAGSDYTFENFEGKLFDELFRKYETVSKPRPSDKGTSIERETYIVGRDVIKNQEFIIHPEINDLLQFDLRVNGAVTKLQIKLEAGKYNHTELIAHINKALGIELKNKEFEPDLLQARMGGVDSGTTQDDSDKMVFKINRNEDGRNDSGSYVIDSIRGTAAYTFFYPSEGDPEPSHTIGVKDLSGGATIIEGENDTFIVDVDNKEKKIILPPGNYNRNDLLEKINEQLSAVNAGIIASYFEGKLKLSTTETGQIPIDGIRGNARGTLFYETETRKEDQEWTFQTGPNSGNNVTMDKARTSAKLLRINTLMIDNPTRAEKALQRLDNAIQTISRERSKVGAYTNRLEHAMNSVRMTNENLTRTESLIRDTDIAKQMMEKVKNDLLLAANQTVITHVNNQPGKVLELLR